jgi:PEP-CTERM motif
MTSMKGTLATALLLLSAASAQSFADPIVIEPDDFSLGAQITSPDATISYYSGNNPTALFATDQMPGMAFPAPTGHLTFGASALTFFTQDVPFTGLYFKFNEPVSSVSIWALNSGYAPGLGIDCRLWPSNGEPRTACAGQGYEMAQGEAHRYTLDFGGAAFDAIGLGGDFAIAAVVFDRLEATRVPEPATTALFGVGLVGLLLARRKALRPR